MHLKTASLEIPRGQSRFPNNAHQTRAIWKTMIDVAQRMQWAARSNAHRLLLGAQVSCLSTTYWLAKRGVRSNPSNPPCVRACQR